MKKRFRFFLEENSFRIDKIHYNTKEYTVYATLLTQNMHKYFLQINFQTATAYLFDRKTHHIANNKKALKKDFNNRSLALIQNARAKIGIFYNNYGRRVSRKYGNNMNKNNFYC